MHRCDKARLHPSGQEAQLGGGALTERCCPVPGQPRGYGRQTGGRRLPQEGGQEVKQMCPRLMKRRYQLCICWVNQNMPSYECKEKGPFKIQNSSDTSLHLK